VTGAAGDPGSNVPPGYVLIRIDDLAVILADRRERAAETPAAAAQTRALAAVVSLLTGELTDAPLTQAELVADASMARIVRLLVVMSTGLMRGILPGDGAGLLRDLGAAAALAEGAG
jgi:hypothetical protein